MCLDTFDGSGTPTDAADWLRKMEKVMAACRMTAEEMVLFIPHQLTGQADVWWVGVCDAWTPARGAITWEVFLAQFRAKYYPDSFRDKMNDALNDNQQGTRQWMSMREISAILFTLCLVWQVMSVRRLESSSWDLMLGTGR